MTAENPLDLFYALARQMAIDSKLAQAAPYSPCCGRRCFVEQVMECDSESPSDAQKIAVCPWCGRCWPLRMM